MLKKIRLSILALFCTGMAFAQSTGSIVFNVVDDGTKSSLPFASVVVTRGGQQVGGGQTDMDGNVEVKPLDPGQYDVKAVYAGYHDFTESGIVVVPNTPVHVTIKMVSASVQMKEFVVKYTKPAVDPSGHVNNSLDQADIKENPLKGNNPLDMVGMMSGVTQTDIGQPINMGGSRSEENQIIIDGVKISGDQSSGGLPQNMISEVNTYIGGVPAKYGDVTGGVIEINTLNASPKFFGSAEAITSEGLDAFGHNDFNFVIGGPIWTKKDSNHKKALDAYPSVNFILGGEVAYDQTANPSFVGGTYVNSSTQTSLDNTPLTPNPLGGYYAAANYINATDFYHTKGYLDDQGLSVSGNAKVDLRVNKMVTVTVGATYQYNTNNDFSETNMLFNSAAAPLTTQNSYRGFIRLRQRFATAAPSKDGKPALIQNAYYTLQAEYGNTYTVNENKDFKTNFFEYGYVGQFNIYQRPVYTFEQTGLKGPGYYQTGSQDTLITFTPGTQNPILANYTNYVFNAVGGRNFPDLSVVQQDNGLLNGAVPTNNDVYSLWNNVGTPYGSYSQQNSNHFRFTANFSATIKNNDVQVGFEYEQNSLSFWSIGAAGLWLTMRENINTQISQYDLNNPYLIQANQYNEYGYNQLYNGAVQSQFDKSLRQKLGMPINGTTMINIDQYAPSTYSLSMFSASDLLNNGSSIVSYNGYGYNGNNQSGTPPTINDFFNQRDANGNLTYPIAPYQPIYIAGYIQDHFEFKSLRFDVGLRVDRFDANQPTLKDPYLLYPAKTVSEVRGTALGGEIPNGVSGNDVVYVNNSQSPTEIVGYRNGSSWYNASGALIADPTVLASATSTGGIQPYLENPSQTSIGANAFTTYTPQVNVMPRIAFSFPISDMAGFFAHYDILTARPPGVGYNIFNPLEYEFISSYANSGSPLANPALKPVATTDYELGFTQALNEKKSTALTLSAFYRAPKNEIESYRFLDVYPISYIAYNNIDFGTIKGLTLAYTLSRVGDFKMRASYTLQFATGTGSGPNSGYNLANSGQPNLQIPMPLSFDQRHTIQVNLDYHFQSGEGYDGPTIKTHSGSSSQILSNAGVNVNFVASSGTPYTVQSNATEGNPNTGNVGIGISQHYGLVGSVNGSYLPWQYRVDLKVDKDFPIMIKGKDKNSQGHPCDLQAYLTITNLLNTENILNVYGYTGSATSDGYLASASGMQSVAGQTSPQAYIDQYKIKEQDPSYLAMPRTIRLGVSFNF